MSDIIELRFDYSVPDLLADKVTVSTPYQNYNARGNPSSFGVDMDFPEMELSKTLKSSDFHLLKGKIEDTMRSWERKYQSHLDRQHKQLRTSSVDEMNQEAQEAIKAIQGILEHTLGVDDTVDWDAIKRREPFRTNRKDLLGNGEESDFITLNTCGKPMSFDGVDRPFEPTMRLVRDKYGFFARIFRRRTIKADFEKRLGLWQDENQAATEEDTSRGLAFEQALADFEKAKEAFKEDKKRDNDRLEDIKSRYSNGDPKAVEEYCDLVLNNSEYPDYFPKNWTLEYRPDSHMVVVDYHLPSPSKLPTVKSYKYVTSRDEIVEQAIPESERKRLYESLTYQICIRTIHELIESDSIDAIDAVAFNGLVTNTNPATGIKETKTILSVLADKSEFLTFDLSRVAPKATFKHLKGIAATTLIDLTPIPPVMQLDKTDKRFIDGKVVAAQLDESMNIAAMHWEDFEHLIRELFEKEFTASGGEVRVTQASSDGGVDAVAFDPDPIRGGKIVIQAKRYTNTIGVSAVRDLYGTVMNEGATKGILVTTSDYGRDSYEFAKDKPITLLNGNNLLALLEKHGHKARINVTEAKNAPKT